MASLSEEIKSESPVQEETRSGAAESPSIHGSGDAMWSVDQSAVDVQQAYTVTRNDGSTYTVTPKVAKPRGDSHGSHRNVEEGTSSLLPRTGGASEKYKTT